MEDICDTLSIVLVFFYLFKMGSVGSVYEPKKLIMYFKQMQLDMCKYIMYMQTIQMYQIIYIYLVFFCLISS